MPQQRSTSGTKTPTWPARTSGSESSASDPKFSPPCSNFEEGLLMLGARECGSAPLSSRCCFPGCLDADDFLTGNLQQNSSGIVKLSCSKENCGGSGWMHRECWKLFEESTDKIVSNGKQGAKGRAWNEKQKALKSNGRKGSWECSACSRITGDKTSESSVSAAPPVKFSGGGKKAKAKKQGSTGSSSSTSSSSSNSSSAARLSASFQHQLSFDGTTPSVRGHHARSRTLSLCSAGSSPPNGSEDAVGSAPNHQQPRFEFFSHPLQAAVGNIFFRRAKLDAFACLPQHQQNPYQIKVEDEGPHGNDEIRSFILTTLSAQRVTSVICCTCGHWMEVFDKYPLIDGTFFLSPLCYSGSESAAPVVEKGSRKLYLNAICVECLSADLSSNPDVRSKCLRCSFCERIWSGSRFLMGSMYSYDIFSAVPCCQARLLCNSCRLPVVAFECPDVNINGVTGRCFPGYGNCGILFGNGYVGFPKTNGTIQNGFQVPVSGGKNAPKFFSDYSKRIPCPHCNVSDYHFIKPLCQVFYVRSRPIY